ncbi:aldose 1-epimerase family protein [Flavihumibacter stibioxidans]|nr:aldose 1-epimerase family protein [Flavihumibacter stibioxidans]
MTEMLHLSNGQIEVVIHPRGAELQVLKSLSTGVNYMWSGDPEYWGKFSPILFPIVGALKNDTYLYNGKEYTLPRHGFARERTFLAEHVSEEAVNFRLVDDAETRACYPFNFQLDVHYRLEENRVYCRYTVTNTGEGPLWFSIGGHPAFAVPLLLENETTQYETTQYEDYFLEFNHSHELNRYKVTGGLIGDGTQHIKLDQGRLPLSKDLFREDALVLKGMPDTEISLGCSKHPHGLHFRFEGFPFFGIWAAPGADFVCLEPWCGIADSVHHNQELTTKEGILSVEPGEHWCRQWCVAVF